MHQPAFATQRFLVVEDEPLIAIALQHLLEQEGATVIQVHNVTRALQLVQTSPLSAGIIDIGLGDDNAGPICDALDRRRVFSSSSQGNPMQHCTDGHSYPSSKSQPCQRSSSAPSNMQSQLVRAISPQQHQTKPMRRQGVPTSALPMESCEYCASLAS